MPDLKPLEEKFLRELDEAMEKLRPAHEEYLGYQSLRDRITAGHVVSRSAAARATGRSAAPAPNGSRARQGTRAEQFAQLVAAEPGKKVSDYARQMGVQPNYLHRLRNTMKAKGEIRVIDGLVYPSDSPVVDPERVRELEAAAAK